jgi:hypothetical protein
MATIAAGTTEPSAARVGRTGLSSRCNSALRVPSATAVRMPHTQPRETPNLRCDPTTSSRKPSGGKLQRQKSDLLGTGRQ